MYELYKGYIPTDSKRAKQKFKDVPAEKLLTYEQAEDLNEFAGVLNDDTILIDVDDFEQSEILFNIIKERGLKCKVYGTSRGKHFLFINTLVKRCMTDGSLACGICRVDIKVGVQYEVLKIDGELREVLYDTKEYEFLPNWMIPVKTKRNFHNLGEGDGRNSALFKHVSILMENEMSKSDIVEAIKILNRFVLQIPLPDDEISKLLRDERFNKPIFYKQGAFQFDAFARWMANNYHMVKISADLFTYNGHCYTNDIRTVKQQMIKEIPKLTNTARNEVYSYLDLIVHNYVESDANLVCFGNGVYNLREDTLLPFAPEYIVTNEVNADYYEEAYDPYVDKALDDFACGDKSVRSLLEELIGNCLYRRNELRKAFVLVGDRQNGKSTFLSMLNSFIGWGNVVALDLKELGDRFKTAQLSGKLVNIGDDIDDEFISNSAVFKKLVTGNPVNAERKGQDPFDFSSYAKLIFSANTVPRIKDRTGAVASRLVLIPFNAHFEPGAEGFDLEIIDKLTSSSARSYLAKLAIDGLKRVLKTKMFTQSDAVANTLDQYVTENNSVLLFVKEEEPEIDNQSVAEIFLQYQQFCSSNNVKSVSKINFSKQVCSNFGFKSVPKNVRGRGVRVFVKDVM